MTVAVADWVSRVVETLPFSTVIRQRYVPDMLVVKSGLPVTVARVYGLLTSVQLPFSCFCH